MSTMVSLLKMHFSKYYKTVLVVSGVLLVIILFFSTMQILVNKDLIMFKAVEMGGFLSLIGIFVFIRGKNGEGKFLSRLPVSSYEVYFSKFITGLMFYVLVFLIFNISVEVVGGFLKLVGYKTLFSSSLGLSEFYRDATSFTKGYLWLVFLVSLVLFLERWMSSGQAIGLIILVPLVILMGIPAMFKLFDINVQILVRTFEPMVDFMKTYGSQLKIFFYLVLLTSSVFLYRLRNFKSF